MQRPLPPHRKIIPNTTGKGQKHVRLPDIGAPPFGRARHSGAQHLGATTLGAFTPKANRSSAFVK
ncbi:unnamed protein product, partial [Didymodactylos carnosus]